MLQSVFICAIMQIRVIKRSKAVGYILPKGGDAMYTYQIIMIIFMAMTFVLALIGLILKIVNIFSSRK